MEINLIKRYLTLYKYRCIYGYVDQQKKKTTFNLSEHTHQGLKFAAASQKREMAELLEQALTEYFGWSKMTKTEKDELEFYRVADSSGGGRQQTTDFGSLCRRLGYPGSGEIVAQLLSHVNSNQLATVQVYDGAGAYKPIDSFSDPSEYLYRNGGNIKLQLTIPGRQHFEQLQAREDWEKRRQTSTEVFQKAAAFRSERVAALENGQALAPLADGPKLVLHCMAVESFGAKPQYDVLALDEILPMYATRLSGWGPRINFEGKLWVALGEPSDAYTQIFRNGVIEAVRAGVLSSSHHPGMIPSLSYEEALVTYLPHCFEILKRLGCNPPVLVGISLIGIHGQRLAVDAVMELSMGGTRAIDRNVLMLPEIVVEDLSAPIGPLLKPALDLVWNACGYTSSPHFDRAGNWTGRAR
jgi:hypothetical protein